jgi:sugar lactone lactonase YvrE
MRPNVDAPHPIGILRLIARPALACAGIVVLIQQPSAVSGGAPGRSEIVASLPAGSQPEGIAMSRTGTLFVANRRPGATTVVNQVLRIERDGTATVFALLPESNPEAEGLLGLTIDPGGTLYAAFASFDSNHGVWTISRDGSGIRRVPGSEAIVFPNALTFDAQGTLFATDSFGGAIWRSVRGGSFSLWVEDPLLAPLPDDPFGFPLPGANGIAFYPPDVLYVANTEQGLLVSVRILPDGRAGAVRAVTAPFSAPTVDGIAVDSNGGIHAALPGFALVGASPLVRIDPATGIVTATVIDPTDVTRFDTPLSVVFGGGQWDVRTLLVTNGDLPVVPGGPGPGVVQVDVGVPGFPIP